ncbi:uncharacterized protein LOC109284492 [Alligator mississippiensis]|uniref:uncharacterized protein LOC109284492 n=1 Tax=Alligator mississippiensis TaxID=8496 RepID=UPI0028776E52|nr:uncharacterized protein LOC109284492 [Alligator mississippiensis]
MCRASRRLGVAVSPVLHCREEAAARSIGGILIWSRELGRGPNGRQQLSRAVPGIPLGLKGGSLVVKSPRATQPHPSMELRLIPAQRLVFSQTHRNFCRLVTNASETAVRAVLTQEEEGAERPVAYTSRKLLPAETRCTDEARTDDPKSQAEEITNLPGMAHRLDNEAPQANMQLLFELIPIL